MAGAGGDGVISAGDALMTAAARVGYRAIMTKSYGPQIRGGESSFRLRLATGLLHKGNRGPERDWRQIEADWMLENFKVNTVLPAPMSVIFRRRFGAVMNRVS